MKREKPRLHILTQTTPNSPHPPHSSLLQLILFKRPFPFPSPKFIAFHSRTWIHTQPSASSFFSLSLSLSSLFLILSPYSSWLSLPYPDLSCVAMAMAARALRIFVSSSKSDTPARELPLPPQLPVSKLLKVPDSENSKIVLQPRLCTLRSYASDRVGLLKTKRDFGNGDGDADSGNTDTSPFFAALSDYIENSKKSHEFEIISGRLAMIVFAATVGEELVTGNSVFRKMEMEGIAEAAGVCLGAVVFAAIFAWFSSARSRVGRIFTVSCNTFIDSIIDQIVDGLFYETDSGDWSDEG